MLGGGNGMSVWQWIKEVIVEIFWPWFKEVAWPFIKQHLKELIIFAFELLKEKLKEWASERAKSNTENASQKADEFEKKAESAKTYEEADKFRAIAQVWREVAEQFRQENELLRRKIDEISKDAEEEASAKVDKLNMDLDFSYEKPKFIIGGDSYNLPALPSSNDTK